MNEPNTQAVPNHIEGWDTTYRANESEWFFGREPSELARLTVSYWRLAHGDRGGRVLDLGCGEGRDAVYFVRRGFDVTAVDGSESALRKAARLAADNGVSLPDLRRMDIRDFPLAPGYDLLFAQNCLQFLGADCLPTLRRLQEVTPPGGFHAAAVFTREAESLAGRADLYRFDRNELKFYYQGWRLFYYGEEILWREPSQRYLSFARIVAQKGEGDQAQA